MAEAPAAPPALSVVIPAYERAGTIGRTLESVRAQVLTDFEVIVVDDGSSDDTAEAARRHAADDPRVRVVQCAHAGVAAARNAGARVATGEHLVFLDCDDEVDERWLARLHEEAHARGGPAPDLVFGAARAVVPGGETRHWRIEHLGPAFGSIDGVFFPGMFAVRRSLFAEVGGYAVGLELSENTELGLRLTAASAARHGQVSARAHHEELLTVRLPPDGTSNAYSDARRFASALYLLDRHGEQLRADRHLLGTYWAIAGVAAARLGRAADARSCLARAVRHDPRLLHLGRLAIALVPPLAARRWPARTTAAPTPSASGAAMGDR